MNPDFSPEIISLGDCLILMNPNKSGSLRYVHFFEKEWAGAEANFLLGCSRLGVKCGFLSAFSTDPFGKMIYAHLKSEGLDLSQIQWDEKRVTPIFFKEKRTKGEFSVYYYRTNTAGSFLDFKKINSNYFSKIKIFFYTGIFPALSKENQEFLQQTLEIVKSIKASLCFDPNIRLKLFRNKKEIQKILFPFLEQAHILLISHNEAEILFGTQKIEKLVQKIEKLGIQQVVLKQGEKEILAWDGKKIYRQDPISVEVVDTCGAGDAFNTGFLYGYIKKMPFTKMLQLGAYCASFAVTSHSDNQNAPTWEELARKINKEVSIDR